MRTGFFPHMRPELELISALPACALVVVLSVRLFSVAIGVRSCRRRLRTGGARSSVASGNGAPPHIASSSASATHRTTFDLQAGVLSRRNCMKASIVEAPRRLHIVVFSAKGAQWRRVKRDARCWPHRDVACCLPRGPDMLRACWYVESAGSLRRRRARIDASTNALAASGVRRSCQCGMVSGAVGDCFMLCSRRLSHHTDEKRRSGGATQVVELARSGASPRACARPCLESFVAGVGGQLLVFPPHGSACQALHQRMHCCGADSVELRIVHSRMCTCSQEAARSTWWPHAPPEQSQRPGVVAQSSAQMHSYAGRSRISAHRDTALEMLTKSALDGLSYVETRVGKVHNTGRFMSDETWE